MVDFKEESSFSDLNTELFLYMKPAFSFTNSGSIPLWKLCSTYAFPGSFWNESSLVWALLLTQSTAGVVPAPVCPLQ